MTSTVPTPEALIESFPHPTLPKIDGTPTYETLADLKTLIAANAATIPSTRGGGTNGHLGIILSPAVYTTVSATAWINPTNPGGVPVIPPGTTAAQTGAIIRTHTEELREWREYNNVQLALKKQLLAAIDPIYLRAIRTRHIGFANRTIRELLTHLISEYGHITTM